MLLQQAVWSLIRLLVASTTLFHPGDSNIYIGPAREPLPKSFQWSVTRLEAQHADPSAPATPVPDLLWQQVRSVDLSAAAAQWRGDPQPDGWQVDLRLSDQHGVQLQPLTSRLVELRWQPVYWTPLDGRSVRLVGGVDAYDQLMGRQHAHPFVDAPAIRPAAQPKDRRWTVRWNPADGPLRLPNRFAAQHGSGTGIGWLSVRITVPGVGVVENATIVADPPPFLVDSWGHYR